MGLVIIQEVSTSRFFPVAWIYDQKVWGCFMLVEEAKDGLKVGDVVSIRHYSPDLSLDLKTEVTGIRGNPINGDLWVTVKDSKELLIFKKEMTSRVK